MKDAAQTYIVRRKLGRERTWQNGGPRLPRLDIELTERCNNNCAHCYINRAEEDRDALEREMSTKKVKEILEEAVALGCMSVRLTGANRFCASIFN